MLQYNIIKLNRKRIKTKYTEKKLDILEIEILTKALTQDGRDFNFFQRGDRKRLYRNVLIKSLVLIVHECLKSIILKHQS